jgi:hypothetical protein
MKKAVIAVLLLLCTSVPAMAATNINLPPTFTQSDFKDLSRDLGLIISYVPLATAEPLGGVLPHVDAGVEVSAYNLDTNSSYWQKIKTWPGNADIPSTLPVPRFHIQVGLPVIPIDLGYVYASVPGTDVKYMGGEIKWAILSGSVATPAVAIRGAYTKLSGVTDMDISTKSVDLSISKGFAMFTPYAGYGMVWIESKEKSNDPLVNLQDESLTEGKGFIGCKISFFPLLNLVVEADFAKVSSYSARLNLHF